MSTSAPTLAAPANWGRFRPSAWLADRLLACWYLAWFLLYARRGGIAWHFFAQGQQALFNDDAAGYTGLHLYAGLPQLQIGPLALLAAAVFSLLGAQLAVLAAQLFGALAGVAVLWLAIDLAGEARPDLSGTQVRWRARLVALFFTPPWLYLASGSVHLDDVLAMLFGVAALHLAVRQQAVLAGLAVGLAIDSKPWALPFAALLLVLTGNGARLRALAAVAGSIAAGWLPFLLYDPHTLNAAHFTIANTPRSALRVLGIDTPRTPSWDRPAQALLGVLLAGAAIRKGRWGAAILLAVGARIVLDPGTNIYYSGGIVAAAAVWDIAGSRLAWPWWTAAGSICLYASRYVPLPQALYGWMTLGYVVIGALYVLRRADPADPRPDPALRETVSSLG